MKKVSIVVVIIFVILLPIYMIMGCEDNREKLKGGYVEEDYTFPDDIQDILDMAVLDNGNIAIIGHGNVENRRLKDIVNEPLKYFESKNKGKTWTERKLRIPKNNIENIIAYEECKILHDGSFVFAIREFTTEELDNLDIEYLDNKNIEEYDEKINIKNPIRIVRGDSNGNLTEIPSEKLDGDNYKIISAVDKYVYLMQSSPKEIIKFDVDNEECVDRINIENEYIASIVIDNKKLYINNNEEVIEYNLKNGTKEGENEVLTKNALKNYNYYRSINGKTIYLVGEDGVYSYLDGNKVIEKLIDGTSTIFEDKEYHLESFMEVSDNEFIAAFMNKENYKIILKHFYYDKDANSNTNK